MKLTLTDADGVVVDQWTLADDPDVFYGVLAQLSPHEPAAKAIDDAIAGLAPAGSR